MKFAFGTLHEKGWFKSIAAVAAFSVSALGLVGALKPYFHSQSGTPALVTPAVQVGPAAAGQRTLDDASKTQILRELGEKDATVLIVSARGDDEAAHYAKDIKSFLEEQGFRGVGLSSTSFPPFAHGVSIEKDGHRAFVKVEHQ